MSAGAILESIAATAAALDADEAAVVRALGVPLDAAQRAAALATGVALVRGARARSDERSHLDAFLAEFGLSNPEGIALLCLAEALLRIPDDDTADRLIAEKLAAGDWAAHAGGSDSLFVNASTWGLMLTGRIVELPDEIRRDTGGWLQRMVRRAGEPLVRQAVRRAVRIIGGEFVVGDDIEAALARCRREPGLALCSFDMLGEGARSGAQARRSFANYVAAIEAIGAAGATPEAGSAFRPTAAPSPANSPGAAPGLHARHAVSIKLSALEPRLALAQSERVRDRLVPRALELARLAARHGIGLTIDAEEEDRLEIMLEVVAALAHDAVTRDWPGLGLAVQAYNRRAPAVLDWIAALAAEASRAMTVRLVKGAYWDSEIKRAQERGLAQYPVYTRKASTDLAWLHCARRLFAHAGRLHPQFATHNAHSIAAVLALRPPGAPLEFQRLHGMGELLYDEARLQLPELPPVRVYAPVGPYADLLAYLVRRLLENGANTSFVNRFMDAATPVEAVVVDPIDAVARLAPLADPRLPLPPLLFGAARANSRGADFGRRDELARLRAMAAPAALAARLRANDTDNDTSTDPGTASRAAATAPTPSPDRQVGESLRGARVAIRNPADQRECAGELRFASTADLREAFEGAAAAQREWDARGGSVRAAVLERAADALERARPRLLRLLVREAGKTLPDAVAEIREAADFCRYYAAEARRLFATPVALPGPTGESNTLSLQGRGVLACVSPWNFPLAIFTGQVVAALAAGNAVVAKPAESTPLVAAVAVELLHAAGVPHAALQFMPMAGRDFGAAALAEPRLAGVVFTGSTRTAQWLNRALAARDGAILPLIAETGGVNAMIVDSSALPEHVVDDVVASAFASAGQHCSALRLLCLQEEIAERVLALLEGAMDELVIGDPADPATDLGPVISAEAVAALEAHVARMRAAGRLRHAGRLDAHHAHGHFVAPQLIEVDSVDAVGGEHFGPLLHVLRYRSDDLEALLATLHASGYGLTLGVQTRLDSTWRTAFARTRVGNVYVNRNMIGAVVGVQPFGGSGLSGTGPKAGGPHYLARLALERTLTVNTTAAGGNAALLGGEP